MNGHELAGFLAPLLAGMWLLSRPHVSQALTVAAATGTATATVVTGRARRQAHRGLADPRLGTDARITLPGLFDGVPAAPPARAERRRTGDSSGRSPNHPACRFYVEQGIRELEEMLSDQADH